MMQALLKNLANPNDKQGHESRGNAAKTKNNKSNKKMDQQLSSVINDTRNAISNRALQIMKSNRNLNEGNQKIRNENNAKNIQKQQKKQKYNNTFYQADMNPNVRNEDPSKNEQIQDTLSKSKQLIAEMQIKRNNNFGKSNKSITSSSNINGSYKNIGMNTKQRIENSLKHIKSNKSIAEEILYSTNPDSHNSKTENINTDNKRDYLNVINHMFGPSSSKNKRRSSKRKQKYQQQVQEEQPITKNKSSKQLLQAQLQKQLNRNVLIKGNHHYIHPDGGQDDNGQDHITKIRDSNRAKQLNKYYEQQLRQIDENIKSKERKYKEKDQDQNVNNNEYLSVSAQRRTNRNPNINNYGDSKDRISIQIKSTNSLVQNNQNANKQQLIDLSLSQSSQDEQYLKKSSNKQQDNMLGLLVKQITRDIQNLRASSRRNLNSSRCNAQTSYDMKNINNDKMGTSINNAMKYSYTYNTNAPSSSQNQQQNEQISNIKNKKSSSDTNNSRPINKMQNKQEDDRTNNTKNPSGLYSFRQSQSHIADNFNADDLINNIFNLPTQDNNKAYLSKDNPNSNGLTSEIKQQDERPYHTDYGIGLTQDQVYKMLSTISKRIKYSPIVIQQIPYEHKREDNNQLQIDSRFNKQTKDRRNLMDKIIGYNQLNKKYVRYRDYDMYNSVRAENHKIWEIIKSPFKLDQPGNRILKDQKIWRSPGKSKLQHFKSLNTPILNGEYCCKFPQKKIYQNGNREYDNYKSLMMCRSADTLATLNRSSSNKLFRKKSKQKKVRAQDKIFEKQDKFKRIHSDSQELSEDFEFSQLEKSENEQYQKLMSRSDQLFFTNKNNQQKSTKCLMKQNQWDKVKQLRKQFNNQINNIDNSY